MKSETRKLFENFQENLNEAEELKESEINQEVQAILTGPLHGDNIEKIKELGYNFNQNLGLISNKETGKGIELAHFPMGEKSGTSVTVFTDLYGSNTTKETYYFDSIQDIDLNLQEILDTPSKIEEDVEDENSEDFIKMVDRVEEATGYTREQCEDIVRAGDFTWFSGVETDFDLGKAYVDLVGGIEGITNPQNYVLRDYVKQNVINNMDSEKDYSDEEIDAIVDEMIEVAKIDEDNEFFKEYFDYDKLGRELGFDGYTFVEDGCICIN